MEEKQKYQYWLRCIRGVGNKKQRKVVEYCGSANEVYGLTRQQLGKLPGISGLPPLLPGREPLGAAPAAGRGEIPRALSGERPKPLARL